MGTIKAVGRRAIVAGLAGASLLPAAARAQAPLTLRVFTGGQQRPDVMRRVLDVYQGRNPGVRVEIEIGGATSDQQQQYLNTVLASRDAALDVILIDVIRPAQWAAARWAEPLDAYLGAERDAVMARYLPAYREANVVGGKVMALPYFADAQFLYFRRDLLAKHQVAPPKTWDELTAGAQKILAAEAATSPNLRGFSTAGAPIEGSHIGGFYGSTQPSPELFLRWLGAAVFSSHFRFHGIGPREPWSYGAEAENVARVWLDLRMRLIPYLHAVARDAARTGLPVMRAMALAFPRDRAARGFEEQFCCGPALLVAPILRPGGNAELWLPEGGWYDLWSGQRHEGGRMLRLTNLPLDRLPVFGREGHTLPLGRAVQHTGEIDGTDPIDEVITFGTPREPPAGGLAGEGKQARPGLCPGPAGA